MDHIGEILSFLAHFVLCRVPGLYCELWEHRFKYFEEWNVLLKVGKIRLFHGDLNFTGLKNSVILEDLVILKKYTCTVSGKWGGCWSKNGWKSAVPFGTIPIGTFCRISSVWPRGTTPRPRRIGCSLPLRQTNQPPQNGDKRGGCAAGHHY